MLAKTIPMPMPMGEEMEKTKIDMMAWQAPKLDWAMFRPETIKLTLRHGLALFRTRVGLGIAKNCKLVNKLKALTYFCS